MQNEEDSRHQCGLGPRERHLSTIFARPVPEGTGRFFLPVPGSKLPGHSVSSSSGYDRSVPSGRKTRAPEQARIRY
jgi:hypothetical protein